MEETKEFEFVSLLQVLHDHGVAFIVIGGMAAIAHGSPMATQDLDICYARTEANHEALARALQSLGATLRGAPPEIPFELDAQTIKMGDRFSFTTRLGDLDCVGIPSGTEGYRDLLPCAVEIDFDVRRIKFTGLDDLIRMKRAAGRTKDRIALENLGALRAELDGEPDLP
jgi:hypothetical protein